MTCPHVNDVTLLGKLAEDPVRRALPSGLVVAWRLIVDRPRTSPGRRVVDTLACATYEPTVIDQTPTWRTGDLIEVHGSLRRRFWRPDELGIGRYEVEVYEATLVAVSPAPAASTPPGAATSLTGAATPLTGGGIP